MKNQIKRSDAPFDYQFVKADYAIRFLLNCVSRESPFQRGCRGTRRGIYWYNNGESHYKIFWCVCMNQYEKRKCFWPQKHRFSQNKKTTLCSVKISVHSVFQWRFHVSGIRQTDYHI